MTRSELARLLDHSVLKPEATEADIRAGVDVVRAWRIGFFCVQPCWVTLAAERWPTATRAWSASSAFRTAATGSDQGPRRGARRRRMAPAKSTP